MLFTLQSANYGRTRACVLPNEALASLRGIFSKQTTNYLHFFTLVAYHRRCRDLGFEDPKASHGGEARF